MQATRPAAVAGMFYPGEPSALAAEITCYLAEAPGPVEGSRPPKAIIAPHAGYVYSGPIAAQAYARFAPLHGIVRRVVLLGPAHREWVAGAAVPRAAAFDSPLGAVAIDAAAVSRLRALPFVQSSDRAHALEHSLEVHLPFLQAVLGDFKLVPVVVGGATAAEVARLLDELWGGEETRIVVSSDLSHYLPYREAREHDRQTAEAILRFDARLVPEDACGAAPINGLLAAARRRGLAIELVDLRNSGDTAGDRDRVVGYGAFALVEPPGA
jgi:hypothetical protein